jgi:hypothetical protein
LLRCPTTVPIFSSSLLSCCYYYCCWTPPPPVARWIDRRNLQQGANSEFASATNLGFGAHAALLPLQTSNALWAGTWQGINRVPSSQGQCGTELLTLPELNSSYKVPFKKVRSLLQEGSSQR